MSNDTILAEIEVAEDICQRRACPFIDTCPVHPKPGCALCDMLECAEATAQLQRDMEAESGSGDDCLGELKNLFRYQELAKSVPSRA